MFAMITNEQASLTIKVRNNRYFILRVPLKKSAKVKRGGANFFDNELCSILDVMLIGTEFELQLQKK